MIRKAKHTIRFNYSCILFAMILFFDSAILNAQIDTLETDTTQTYFSDTGERNTEYFTQNNWSKYVGEDTSILQMQKFNPARNQDIPFAYLTNLGAPYYNRLFSFDRELGFDLGRNSIALYQNKMENLKYYRTNAPFTEIFYLLGTKGEQWIRFHHTQNITPRLNIALGFDKPIATGFYLRERKSYSNADLTVNWRTKDDRYKVYLGFIFNELDNEENGGISVDSLFDGYEGPRNLAEIYRDNAITEWWSFQGQLTHTYDFGKSEEKWIDDTTALNIFTPTTQLMHRFGAANFGYSFKDATMDDTYYPIIYSDADTLRDVSDVDGFYNYISFGNLHLFDPDSLPLLWEFSIKQQSYNLTDNSGSYNKNFLIPAAEMHLNILEGLFLNGKIGMDVIHNDFSISASLNNQSEFFTSGILASYKKIAPDWMQQHYDGFAYRWDNTFKDIGSINFGVYADVPKLFSALTVSYSIFDNYIFYDSTALPFQETKAFQSIQFQLKQHFKFGYFYLDNFFQVQFLSDFKKNFPVYASNHSFYFMHNLFKSALIIQTGVDVWYASNYYGYGYNIVNGQFYLQDNTKLDFTPVVDVFINFDIKALRFFLKFDNLSMGFFDCGYYEAPRYPMQDRTFKIGINWQLYY